MKAKFCLLSLLFVCTVIISSCGDKKQSATQAPSVIGVESIKSDIQWPAQYPAQVIGSLDIQVRAQVNGILKERKFVEGQFVEKDTPLYLIDPEQYQVALDKAKAGVSNAQASLNKAQADWKRMESLYAQNAISKRDYDNASAAYDSAKAGLETAQASQRDAEINLKYTQVFAPISGIIGQSLHDIGSLISIVGSEGILTTIVQIDPLQVTFSIPGRQVTSAIRDIVSGNIKTPDTTNFKSDIIVEALIDEEGTIYPHKGTIIFVDAKEDPHTGSVAMKAEFANPERSKIMLPGQFIRVNIKGVVYKDMVVIPNTAILETAAGPSVYVVDSNMTSKAVPVTYKNIGDITVIMSGLSGGETIISEGVVKVVAGKPVNVEKKDFTLPEKFKVNTPSDLNVETQITEVKN